MANYISKSDIEAIFGADNVVKWSNLDNDDAQANETRIDNAIDYGESYIDDMLRGGRYATPITGTIPKMVIDMSAKMAGVWLFQTRGIATDEATVDWIQGLMDQVDSLLASYTSGQRTLDAARSHSDATVPQVVT